jgi:hypothetical protein
MSAAKASVIEPVVLAASSFTGWMSELLVQSVGLNSGHLLLVRCLGMAVPLQASSQGVVHPHCHLVLVGCL